MANIEKGVFSGREIPGENADPEIIRVFGVVTLFNLGDNLAIIDRNQRILDAREAKARDLQTNS